MSGAVCCDFERWSRGSEHPRERGVGILTAQLRSHALICLGLIHTKPALPIQYLFSCSAVNTALSQEMRANIKTTETDIKKDVAFMTDQYVAL